MGIWLLAIHICIAWNWTDALDPERMPQLYNPNLPAPPVQWWSVLYWTQGVVPVFSFWWIELISIVCYLIGWKTKLAAFVILLIETAVLHRAGAYTSAEETMARMFMFFSLICPVGWRLSLEDVRRKRVLLQNAVEPPGDPLCPENWGLRLFQISIFLVYFISLPQKLVYDPTWLSGDAVYYVMINQAWSRWPWPEIFYWKPLSFLATYVAILSESVLPILAWFPRYAAFAAFGMMMFHLTLALFLQGITFFSLAFACAFWIFVPADTIKRFLLRRKFFRRYLAIA